MEGPPNDYQVAERQPEQTEMIMNWKPPVVETARGDEAFPRRLEWIAIILFIVSFFAMMFSYSIFMDNEGAALAIVALSTAVAVILLLSVVFSMFGRTGLSRIFLVAGIVGLMVVVISDGVKLMQTISEYHDMMEGWPF